MEALCVRSPPNVPEQSQEGALMALNIGLNKAQIKVLAPSIAA